MEPVADKQQDKKRKADEISNVLSVASQMREDIVTALSKRTAKERLEELQATVMQWYLKFQLDSDEKTAHAESSALDAVNEMEVALKDQIEKDKSLVLQRLFQKWRQEIEVRFLDEQKHDFRKAARLSLLPEVELECRRKFEAELNNMQDYFLQQHYHNLAEERSREILQLDSREREVARRESALADREQEAGGPQTLSHHTPVQGCRVGLVEWGRMTPKEVEEFLKPYRLDASLAKAQHGHEVWLSEVEAPTRSLDKEPSQPLLSPFLKKVAIEIIRRTKPNDPIVQSLAMVPFARLEFDMPYPREGSADMKSVREAFEKGKVLPLKKTCISIRKWLNPKRSAVASALRLHYVVRHEDEREVVALYLQNCVDFFDKLYTRMVCEVTGKDFRGGSVLRLGGTKDLSAWERFGLDVGGYEDKNLLLHNLSIWEKMPAKA